MTIKYDIIMDDNIIYPISYVCFGSLNHLTDGRMPDGIMSLQDLPYTHTNGSRFSVSGIEYIRYDMQHTAGDSQSFSKLLDEFKMLLSEIPSIKDALFIKGGFLYVRVKDQPADKVIFILQMVRNLARVCSWGQDFSKVNSPYAALRSNGISPAKALVFSNLVSITGNTSWSSNQYSFTTRGHVTYGSESSLFSFRSFGLESYRRFIAQDNYNPWYQQTFAESGHGYKRSSHFGRENISYEGLSQETNSPEMFVVSGRSSGWGIFRPENVLEEDKRTFSTSSVRVLEDCHSIVGDETPLLPDVAWDPSCGFHAPVNGIFSQVNSNGEKFRALVEYINNLN